MTDETIRPGEVTFAERWVADFRLAAVLCGAVYGALALGALIALNALAWLVLRDPVYIIGCAAGVAGAFLAYLNFTLVASDGDERGINVTMIASIISGVLSALVFAGAAV